METKATRNQGTVEIMDVTGKLALKRVKTVLPARKAVTTVFNNSLDVIYID